MIRTLTSARKGAAKGAAKRAVVLLHGYGADGNDLLGLADPLAPHLPDTAFFAPNAPDRSSANPMGYQWFPIPWLDGSSEEVALAAMAQSVADVNAFLDTLLAEEEIAPENLILFGFSQGTMMSLHVAPRRAEAVAGVVGFSGRLMQPESLAAEAQVKPPILLVHGDQDEVVPPQSLQEAGEALQAAGFTVYAHVMKGTGHGIAPDGLSVALAFMREKLGLDAG
ncbi:MAG: alpha/beta fold hydrolase [Pseudomonadota bacterium]